MELGCVAVINYSERGLKSSGTQASRVSGK